MRNLTDTRSSVIFVIAVHYVGNDTSRSVTVRGADIGYSASVILVVDRDVYGQTANHTIPLFFLRMCTVAILILVCMSAKLCITFN